MRLLFLFKNFQRRHNHTVKYLSDAVLDVLDDNSRNILFTVLGCCLANSS